MGFFDFVKKTQTNLPKQTTTTPQLNYGQATAGSGSPSDISAWQTVVNTANDNRAGTGQAPVVSNLPINTNPQAPAASQPALWSTGIGVQAGNEATGPEPPAVIPPTGGAPQGGGGGGGASNPAQQVDSAKMIQDMWASILADSRGGLQDTMMGIERQGASDQRRAMTENALMGGNALGGNFALGQQQANFNTMQAGANARMTHRKQQLEVKRAMLDTAIKQAEADNDRDLARELAAERERTDLNIAELGLKGDMAIANATAASMGSAPTPAVTTNGPGSLFPATQTASSGTSYGPGPVTSGLSRWNPQTGRWE